MKYHFMTFAHFLIEWFISLPLSFKHFLCILDMNSLSDMWLVFQYFLSDYSFSFISLNRVFLWSKIYFLLWENILSLIYLWFIQNNFAAPILYQVLNQKNTECTHTIDNDNDSFWTKNYTFPYTSLWFFRCELLYLQRGMYRVFSRRHTLLKYSKFFTFWITTYFVEMPF